EVMVDVVLLRDRQHATIDELAHGLLNGALFVGQIEIHSGCSFPPRWRNATADPTPEGALAASGRSGAVLCLGGVHRPVGRAEHGRRILAVVGARGDAEAGAEPGQPRV